MSIYHTKEYHVQLITNMVAEGIAGELLESYIESAYEAAHRAGWEQCKEACVEIAREHNGLPSNMSEYIARNIAAMEYKEPTNER